MQQVAPAIPVSVSPWCNTAIVCDVPDPTLEKRIRRVFKPKYRLRIVQEANASKHSELGSLLRLEKPYSNQLSE